MYWKVIKKNKFSSSFYAIYCVLCLILPPAASCCERCSAALSPSSPKSCFVPEKHGWVRERKGWGGAGWAQPGLCAHLRGSWQAELCVPAVLPAQEVALQQGDGNRSMTRGINP